MMWGTTNQERKYQLYFPWLDSIKSSGFSSTFRNTFNWLIWRFQTSLTSNTGNIPQILEMFPGYHPSSCADQGAVLEDLFPFPFICRAVSKTFTFEYSFRALWKQTQFQSPPSGCNSEEMADVSSTKGGIKTLQAILILNYSAWSNSSHSNGM